jgi:hypothetical protein
VATYRIIRPLTAFDPKEKRAFTIPSGSVVEKEESFVKFGLVEVEWNSQIVLVQAHDLIEGSEPLQ